MRGSWEGEALRDGRVMARIVSVSAEAELAVSCLYLTLVSPWAPAHLPAPPNCRHLHFRPSGTKHGPPSSPAHQRRPTQPKPSGQILLIESHRSEADRPSAWRCSFGAAAFYWRWRPWRDGRQVAGQRGWSAGVWLHGLAEAGRAAAAGAAANRAAAAGEPGAARAWRTWWVLPADGCCDSDCASPRAGGLQSTQLCAPAQTQVLAVPPQPPRCRAASRPHSCSNSRRRCMLSRAASLRPLGAFHSSQWRA